MQRNGNGVVPEELDLISWLVKLAEQEDADKREWLQRAKKERVFFSAHEYGPPCVTSIAEATRAIKHGDPLTVDGYLDLVTLDRNCGEFFYLIALQ